MAATPNTEPPLIQPISMTPPPPTPQPAQQSGKAGDLPPGRIDNAEMPETATKPDSQGKPAGAEKDPTRELLDRIERLAPATADPGLARMVQSLSQRGVDPDQRAQPGFRHDVAYALQDMEKSLGRLELPPALRTEMTQLAGTAVGLTNERMRALMGATATIEDRSLVVHIRDFGKEIGRLVNQSRPETESKIDALENRARLTPRPADLEASARAPGARGQNADSRPPDAPPNGLRDDQYGPGSGPGSPPNGARYNGNPKGDAYQNGGNNQGQVTIQHSVLDTLLRAMRPDANQAQPPWEPPATPVADRIATNERRVRMEADDRTLASAERRGQAALDALQGFTNGEGAAVMSRIREAAKTEPGGMSQVLSEMRDGGRFADLRRQFGNALSDDAGFAAAYDKAAGALAAYGKTRTEIEPILARRPDATAFTQRLTEMDAEIGKAAAATPSKTEGRSMMEELTKQASELLQRAVDAVKAAFTRSASPSASSSPSPSP
jgi:hypothetical protein